MINTEIHNWSMCRKQESMECSAINSTTITLPLFMDQESTEKKRKTDKQSQMWDNWKETVSWHNRAAIHLNSQHL